MFQFKLKNQILELISVQTQILKLGEIKFNEIRAHSSTTEDSSSTESKCRRTLLPEILTKLNKLFMRIFKLF